MNNRKYVEFLDSKLNCVGENIRQLRTLNNISRQKLSDMLMILGIDIPNQSIAEIENGKRTVVDYELCAIAKILNVTPDYLLKDFKEYLDKI